MNYGSSSTAPSNVAPTDEVNSSEIIERASAKSHQKAFTVVTIISVLGLTTAGVFLSSNNWNSLRRSTAKSASFMTTADSVFAPLILQDTTHETLIPVFMSKYGLTENEVLDGPNEWNSSTTKGWATIDLYQTSDCSGTSYYKGGISTGVCINVYNIDGNEEETSLIFDCTDEGEIHMTNYDGSDCTTSISTNKIKSQGCSALDNSMTDRVWYSSASCVSSGNIPLMGSYNLFKSYIDKDPGTCKSSMLFEASPVSTCIPIDWDGEDHSVTFNHMNLDPYLEIFNSASDCTGKSDRADLETDCESLSPQNPTFPVDADVSITWEYYDSRGR